MVFRRLRRFVGLSRVVKAFLGDLRSLDEIDQVVFSGDLTAVAYRQEFEAAAAALGELRERHDIVGVPGNHDLYVPGSSRERLFEATFPAWIYSDRPDLRVANTHYPLVRHVGPDWAIIAVDSSRPTKLHDSSGMLGQAALEAIDAALDDEALATRNKIIVLHYAPRRSDGTPDTPRHGLRDAEDLLEILRRRSGERGVRAVLHGHIHDRFVLDAGGATPVLLANAGSLTDAKHGRTYHIYDFGEQGVRVRVRRFHEITGVFEDWDDAPGAGFHAYGGARERAR